MKKIISILTVLFLCTQTVLSVFADETEPILLPIETEFTDTNFLNAVREKIGKTNGEHIYKSDVESITELDISDKEIKDLHGIEYFTGLESLLCYANEFPEIDVSHNTELEVLDCSYNMDLTALDVSHNPKLQKLECNYTVVQSLDLTKNLNLTRLVCFGTKMKEVNVNDNINLEYLNAKRLHLTDLDISNNKKLKHLDCSGSKLTKLNVSNNISLQYLDCGYNKLTELDVSNNTALERLYCNNNQLTTLDMSKNILLERLGCQSNQLTELDLSSNTLLSRLNCCKNYMGKEPEKSIADYSSITAKIGQPSTDDDWSSNFKYFPQIEKPELMYQYEITGLRITDTSGVAIEKPQKNKSFIVEADITKIAERDDKDYLFVAVYDTDGALISIDYVKAKFVADGEYSFGFNIPSQEKNVGSVKAFVWNTFNSMEPLSENKILTFTDNQ